jgi:hypothetical protein
MFSAVESVTMLSSFSLIGFEVLAVLGEVTQQAAGSLRKQTTS